MSCKSCVYGANTASQNIVDGGTINFGSIVRRFGNNTNIAGGNGVVIGEGYYDIDTNITFTAAAGTVTIALYKDGVPITGATATRTTAATSSYTITIPALVRQKCCCESVITAVLTGEDTTVTNAAIIIEKV